MKNRVSQYLDLVDPPKRTSMKVECPYCHGAVVTVPYEATEPTLCPVCDAIFRAVPCPDGNKHCCGHANVEASAELKAAVKEWRAAHAALVRDRRDFPHEWTACWKGNCAEGIEVARGPFGMLMPVGLCDECDGTGKLRRS